MELLEYMIGMDLLLLLIGHKLELIYLIRRKMMRLGHQYLFLMMDKRL
jgi:hypothetical protein